MKKMVCVWLAVLTVAGSGWFFQEGPRPAAWAEEEAQTLELDGQQEAVAQPMPQLDGDMGKPQVLWSFGVSLTSLYARETMLVNRNNLLEADYEPSDLVKMTVKRATSAAVYMQRVVALAVESMFDAAKEQGYTLYL